MGVQGGNPKWCTIFSTTRCDTVKVHVLRYFPKAAFFANSPWRLQEKLARPSGEEKLARPSGEEKLERPSGEEKLARPSGEEKLAGPSGEEKLTRPSGAEKLARPSGEKLALPA